MSTRPQNVKGMRDHLPQAMMLRQSIQATMRAVFERYGFEPLQTPIVEYAETLEGKIGDDEKLIYRFETEGGRRFALRYDQTVPLARVVAQYQNQLLFPWRRYAMGQSYRGERPARGRYREFWQADVDIIGSASPLADAEIIALLSDVLAALGFTGFTTLLNHRQIIGGIARVAGLPEAQAGGVYRAIDKFDKIGADGVRDELLRSGIAADAVERIITLVSLDGPTDAVLDELGHRLADDPRALLAITNLREIIAAVRAMGIAEARVAVAPRLARGLSYYTGAVFEAVVADPPMGSLLGGGRYDELIGLFAGRPIPTVGLAFGIERLHDVMTELGLGPQQRSVAQVFVTIFGAEQRAACLALAQQLRHDGIAVETALDAGERLSRQFQHADRRGVPLALVLGPDELAAGTVVVKQLASGQQQTVARAGLIELIRQLHATADADDR